MTKNSKTIHGLPAKSYTDQHLVNDGEAILNTAQNCLTFNFKMKAINDGKRNFNLKNPFKVCEFAPGVHRDRVFSRIKSQY